MSDKKSAPTTVEIEIESLNADDLDIEELENRIELASQAASGCYANGGGCTRNRFPD